MPKDKDFDAFDLWLCYTHAGSFLERINNMEPSYLASIEGICDDSLERRMQSKAAILNAKEAMKKQAAAAHKEIPT